MTVKLKHPYFKDVSIEVEKEAVQEHLDAGWLKSSERRKPAAHTEPVSDVVPVSTVQNSPATDETNSKETKEVI